MSRQALGGERATRVGVRDPQYVTLLQLGNDLLRRFWTVVTLVALCAVAAALLTVARPRTYTSSTSFVPEARQPLSAEGGSGGFSIDGLPWQDASSGLSRPAPSILIGGRSLGASNLPPAKALDPDFYYALLRSEEVLMEVAGSQFVISTPTGVRRGTAADLYELPPGPPLRRTVDAARRLMREMWISYDQLTGMLTLSVRAFDPGFAQAVVERLLDVLRERNRRMDDVRTEAQVAFLVRAAADARQELTDAQDRLARFLAANRAYLPSSPLATTYQRLDDDVLDKRRRYGDVALQLERVKLDRARATQLILVVNPPGRPSGPDARGAVRATVVGAAGGGALALLVVLISAHLGRLRAAGSEALSELEAEWRGVRRLPGFRPSGAPPAAAATGGSTADVR